MSEFSVELQGVSKHFGRSAAVHGADISIRRGEFFALLGPSGCGKTTLLRMIAGLEQPDAGRVRIQGRDMTGVAANERPVNMVFQHYALFPHLSVHENVAFGLRMRKVPRAEADARAKEALEAVHLSDYGARMPAQLSGGQQQRVALARALVNRPEVLLLDEPMAALDEKLRKSMRQELKALQHKVGVTFVYVTHDQEEALAMADRIAVMEKGRVLQVGTPQEIYESPCSSFVADFVGTSNLLKGRVAEVEQLLVETNGNGNGHHRRRAFLEIEELGRVSAFVNGAEPGSEVVLALRPERIHLSTSPVGELENRVPAKVERAVFLGSDVHYQVRLPNGRLIEAKTVYSPLRKVRREGDRVYLQWRAEDASVLGS